MLGICKLNNKSMRNLRREQSYQCVMIDLALLGVISKKQCELLLGSGIPEGLCLPDGSSHIDEVKDTFVSTVSTKKTKPSVEEDEE